MDQNRPIETLRDGKLKIAVWENTSSKGETYYTMTPSKLHEDKDGRLQDRHSFSLGDVSRLKDLMADARVVIKAHDRELSLDRNQDQAPSREGRQDRFQGRSEDRSGPGMER